MLQLNVNHRPMVQRNKIKRFHHFKVDNYLKDGGSTLQNPYRRRLNTELSNSPIQVIKLRTQNNFTSWEQQAMSIVPR